MQTPGGKNEPRPHVQAAMTIHQGRSRTDPQARNRHDGRRRGEGSATGGDTAGEASTGAGKPGCDRCSPIERADNREIEAVTSQKSRLNARSIRETVEEREAGFSGGWRWGGRSRGERGAAQRRRARSGAAEASAERRRGDGRGAAQQRRARSGAEESGAERRRGDGRRGITTTRRSRPGASRHLALRNRLCQNYVNLSVVACGRGHGLPTMGRR